MQYEIGVVGNGVVGKAAALGFAQAGFKVILLCPPGSSSAPRKIASEWDARVFALNHTAKNLLTKLKVWDALDAARIAPIESMSVSDASNNANVLVLDAYTACQNELAWIVEDQNINHALDSALRFASNVTTVAGTVMSMSSDFSELKLADGVSLSAELWVGADGAQSWLRNQAKIGLDYRSYVQSGIVANFSCARPHYGVAHQWFAGEEGIIALLPLPGQRVSLVWSAPDTLAKTLMAEDVYLLAQRLAKYSDPILGELVPLPPQRVQSFPLNFMRPHSMTGLRLALVGDAAHVVHPLAGHGMNLGLADVVTLLETVTQREPWRQCGDERVLQRYARARKEEVMLMQWLIDGLERLFSSSWEPIRLVRSFGLGLVNNLGILKKQLIRQAMGQ